MVLPLQRIQFHVSGCWRVEFLGVLFGGAYGMGKEVAVL